MDGDGRRLAKRDRDMDMTALLKRFTPEEILGRLAYAAGLQQEIRPAALEALIPLYDPAKLLREDLRLKGFD